MTEHPKIGPLPIFGSRTTLNPFEFRFSRGSGFGWSLLLERLFIFAVPLLLATASKKTKSSRKRVKRKPRKSPKQAKARRVKRRAGKKSWRRKRIAPKPSRKTQPKGKAVQALPKAVEDEEPLPPPVPPYGRAILLVPKDATYVESLHPTFRWLSVGGATKYEVQWGEDPTLTNKYSAISLATEATVPVEKPLRVGAAYYWRVRGGNDAGWGPWSPVSSLRVLEETP